MNLRGAVVNMNQSFAEFGLGLVIAVLMVYLVLMAQFSSFIDPFIILMAIPPGLAGVVMILLVTGSTLNIMSLMGVIMMTGIVVSNSILIVEFAGILHKQGQTLAGSSCARMQDPAASDPDDVSGYAAWHDPDGSGPGNGQRAIRSAGASRDRWAWSVRGGYGVSRSGRLSDDPWTPRRDGRRCGRRSL